MIYSIQVVLFEALFLSIGAIGLFAIGAFPLRIYSLIQEAKKTSKPISQTVLLFIFALIAATLTCPFLLKIAKCLLGYHCSANRAGDWINVGFIGTIYICFEVIALAIRLLNKKYKTTL